VQKKAATLDPTEIDHASMPTIDPVEGALDAFLDTPDDASAGALLLAIVDLARAAGIDPETALRAAAVDYRNTARDAELRGPVDR